MAKSISKKPAKKVAAKAKPAPASKKKSVVSIETISEQILDKLKALDKDPQLQSDIGWCLGSYRYDKNPAGLYATTKKALSVLVAAKAKSSRAVSAKLITDIEKVLADK